MSPFAIMCSLYSILVSNIDVGKFWLNRQIRIRRNSKSTIWDLHVSIVSLLQYKPNNPLDCIRTEWPISQHFLVNGDAEGLQQSCCRNFLLGRTVGMCHHKCFVVCYANICIVSSKFVISASEASRIIIFTIFVGSHDLATRIRRPDDLCRKTQIGLRCI